MCWRKSHHHIDWIHFKKMTLKLQRPPSRQSYYLYWVHSSSYILHNYFTHYLSHFLIPPPQSSFSTGKSVLCFTEKTEANSNQTQTSQCLHEAVEELSILVSKSSTFASVLNPLSSHSLQDVTLKSLSSLPT